MSGTIARSAEFSTSRRFRATGNVFAWQGWRLPVPASWNPVKLEGDFGEGFALLADMEGPRLGLRWKLVDAKKVTPEFLQRMIRGEVKAQATEQRGDTVIYLDPQPPGRDVAVHWSADSRRLVQIAYHARRRDRVLVDEIVPSLADTSALPSRPWAVLDLSCAVPGELTLKSHRLNAGDLTLGFGDGGRFVTVRQVAPATLALKRMPLERWLAEQQRGRRVTHRPIRDASKVTLETDDGRELIGLARHVRRRRRIFWKVGLHAECVTLALHDAARDRIVLVEGSDEALARDVARTVGCDFGRMDALGSDAGGFVR